MIDLKSAIKLRAAAAGGQENKVDVKEKQIIEQSTQRNPKYTKQRYEVDAVAGRGKRLWR